MHVISLDDVDPALQRAGHRRCVNDVMWADSCCEARGGVAGLEARCPGGHPRASIGQWDVTAQ